MKETTSRYLIRYLCLITTLFFFLSACAPAEEDDKKNSTSGVPANVAELAGGVFGLIGTVFECTPNPTDPSCNYPSGMSVSGSGDPIALTISLSSLTGPDGVVATGTISLSQPETGSQTVLIDANIQISNHPDGSDRRQLQLGGRQNHWLN